MLSELSDRSVRSLGRLLKKAEHAAKYMARFFSGHQR